MIYLYPHLYEDKYVFSFSIISDSSYIEISSFHSFSQILLASLRRKKEVFIFEQDYRDIAFSKGCHYKFEKDFLYFNPSVRNRLDFNIPDQNTCLFTTLQNHILVK